MAGKLVLVRAFDGQAVVVRIWEADGSTVFVLSQEEYSARIEGRGTLFPIGFPMDDVFELQQELFADLATAYASGDQRTLATLWSRANRLTH